MSRRVLYSFFIFLISAGVVGCASEGAPDLGDWTLQEDELTLTEDLLVSETEEFFFASVLTVDVTSDGRMIVPDWEDSNIKVLRPDGSLIDTLGGPGEGPGEFQMLNFAQVASGDSIYALDPRQSRLTIFGPEAPYKVERTVLLPREKGIVARVHVLGDHFTGVFGSSPIDWDAEIFKPDPLAWRQIDRQGTVGDTLLLFESGRSVPYMEGGSMSTEPVPFDRHTVVAAGPDGRLYHGWPDSLRIEAVALDGASEVVASVPVEPIPVTSADRDSALSDVSDEARSTVASAMPDTKPAFTDLVVADDGRLWVERPADTPDAEMVTWWILDPEAQTIQTAQLPGDVDIEVVKDGQAYGTTYTDAGAPAVVRYRIEA